MSSITTRLRNSSAIIAVGNNFTSIFEDRQGNLWVGTVKGLNKLDRNTGRFSRFLHDPANPHSLGHDYVSFIREDQAGLLWVGAMTGGGLSALDPKTGQFTRYSFHAEEPGIQTVTGVGNIYEDREGVLWLGTLDRGLLKLDRDRKQFIRYSTDPANPNSLPHDTVHALFEDAEGMMWVGTNSGLSRFPRTPLPFVNYKHEARQSAQPVSQRDLGPCRGTARDSCGSGRTADLTGWIERPDKSLYTGTIPKTATAFLLTGFPQFAKTGPGRSGLARLAAGSTALTGRREDSSPTGTIRRTLPA